MISRGTRIRAYNGMLDVLRQGNLAALLVPVGLLVVGWIARVSLSRKTVKYTFHGMTLAHPAGWTVAEGAADGNGDSVVLMDLLGPGRIKPRLTLRLAKLDAPEEGGGPAPAGAAAQATEAPTAAAPVPLPAASPLPLYYEMSEEPVQIGTYSGTRVDSAFAFTPKAIPGRKRDIPVVMRAIDLVVMRGSEALSAQVAAPIDDFESQRANLEAIVASLQIEPAAAGAAPPSVVPNEPAAPPAATPSTVVSGQVIDAQSGLPVPGAIVVLLAPGTSVSDVDDDNLTRVAFTTGMSDSTGHFVGNRGLARSAHYGVMVVADGYRWVGTDDAVTVPDDGPPTFDMGSIPLLRR
ncbi:MAG TPA: carboxypeptidase-like regulatory domain-containing protein [Polyangia bacterium]